jgi:choline dehydrogenase-like flavoprotein
MHVDARTLENHSTIEGDVCVVGSGAAGISFALDWAQTRSKVILLEGGGFAYDDKVQDLYAGKSTGQRYFPLKSARLHYFGGTTGHWSGYCSDFDPIDFEKREWIPHSGWPIRREDLDPYYPGAHTNLDLGPYNFKTSYWQSLDKSLKSILPNEDVVWNKMWQFSPPSRFGKKYKQKIVDSRNIHLYTYANVTNITVDAQGKHVVSVTVKNHAGKEHTVKAKNFVLACCAIQNARILLSSNKQITPGLGNERGNVGRFFMEHLEIKSGELWLTKPDSLKLYEINFGVTKARAELAISASEQRKHKILNGTCSLTPLEIAKHQKPIIDLWTEEDPRKSLDSLSAGFDDKNIPPVNPKGQAYEMFTRIEQAPNPDSRITLDMEVDALGMPRAKLHWILTPAEKRSIRQIHEIVGQELGAHGIGRVRLMEYLRDEKDDSWPSFTGGGWHHMGTTRMSEDPKDGVVDANCKVHSIDNLYVAGSSCFTTAGAVNPTLTLVALTLRLSDHLKKKTKIT